MADFSGAIDYFISRDRTWIGRNDHKSIVLHGTGGSATQTVEQLGDFFGRDPNMASVHYGIGRDGRIAQYVREEDGAGGNGILEAGYDPFWNDYADNPNWHSLSVETINDSANSLALTGPQKETLFRLINYWVHRYNIPLENIKGHFTLQPVNRAHCPGPNFPWSELFSYLNGGAIVGGVPSGWKDDGTVLTAPNGIPVRQGFRQWILDHTWEADNFPLTAEYHAIPLEQSNPSLGNGQVQLFRKERLQYTPDRGVFRGWLGQELRWYEMQPSKISPTIQDDIDQVINAANKLKGDLV